jgi:hypothetical protein
MTQDYNLVSPAPSACPKCGNSSPFFRPAQALGDTHAPTGCPPALPSLRASRLSSAGNSAFSINHDGSARAPEWFAIPTLWPRETKALVSLPIISFALFSRYFRVSFAKFREISRSLGPPRRRRAKAKRPAGSRVQSVGSRSWHLLEPRLVYKDTEVHEPSTRKYPTKTASYTEYTLFWSAAPRLRIWYICFRFFHSAVRPSDFGLTNAFPPKTAHFPPFSSNRKK